MAVSTVDATMRKKFYDEFKVDFEREKSILKPTVRTDGIPNAKTLQFDVIDLSSEAVTRQRDGQIPQQQLDQSTVTVDLVEHFGGTFRIDAFDAFRTNPNIRANQIRKAIAQVNRAVDSQIIAALDATSNQVNSGSAIDFGAYGKILDWTVGLWENDVPNDGRVWGVLSPRAHAQMMTINEYKSTDFVPMHVVKEGVRTGGFREFLGVKWIMHTGLTGVGGNSKNYIYHEDCIGHADNGEPETEVDRNGEHDYYYCWAKVWHAAVATLPRGILRAVNDDTATIG